MAIYTTYVFAGGEAITTNTFAVKNFLQWFWLQPFADPIHACPWACSSHPRAWGWRWVVWVRSKFCCWLLARSWPHSH